MEEGRDKRDSIMQKHERVHMSCMGVWQSSEAESKSKSRYHSLNRWTKHKNSSKNKQAKPTSWKGGERKEEKERRHQTMLRRSKTTKQRTGQLHMRG